MVNELQVSCEGRQYSFGRGRTIRIGRSTDNDVVVSDPTVSRQHARLAWGPDGWVFEGLGRGGTFLGGKAITRLPVSEPVELSLASPEGPVVRLEPRPGGPAVTPDAGSPIVTLGEGPLVAPGEGPLVAPEEGSRPDAGGRGRACRGS